MKSQTIQEQQENEYDTLAQSLSNISTTLHEVLEELKENHNHKFSKRAKFSIEKSLNEIKKGKVHRYKNFGELDKAIS